ncbi:response regulator receiver protein, partial [Bacillus pseudomycoides]
MNDIKNKLLWQEWGIILIRITWIVAIVTLTYQDNPNFPLEIVFISTFLSYVIPVILYKLQSELYVVT